MRYMSLLPVICPGFSSTRRGVPGEIIMTMMTMEDMEIQLLSVRRMFLCMPNCLL